MKKEIVTKSDSVINPLRSLFDFWPTKWSSFFDFDYEKVPISVGGDDNSIKIEVEVPGFNKDEVKVSIEKGVLHVECKNNKKHAYFSSTVPYTANKDTAKVKLENGVLSVLFDRSEESKPKLLTIN